MEMNYDVDGVRGSPALDDGGRSSDGTGGRSKWGFTTEMKTMAKLEDRRFSMPHNSQTFGKPREHHVTSSAGSDGVDVNEPSLPQVFAVKYLGKCDTTGLYGIKHTRKPVDAMVSEGRNTTKSGSVTLPYLKLVVSQEGVDIAGMPQNKNPDYDSGLFPIHTISYGVQDLVYTRVFAMITVHEQSKSSATTSEAHPFQCHAFVCDSRQTARQLTFSLATAFNIVSKSVKAQEIQNKPKTFAIDLRGSDGLDKEELTRAPDDSEV